MCAGREIGGVRVVELPLDHGLCETLVNAVRVGELQRLGVGSQGTPPTGDRAVLGGEQKGIAVESPSGITRIEHDSGDRSVARNRHDQPLLDSGAVVNLRCAAAVDAEPKRARPARRQAPRVDRVRGSLALVARVVRVMGPAKLGAALAEATAVRARTISERRMMTSTKVGALVLD